MKKEYVALTKCFICGEDATILMATRFYDGEPIHDMKKYHGERVPECFCDECQSTLDKDYVAVMEALDKNTLTSRYLFLKKHVAKNIFNLIALPSVLLVDEEVFNKLIELGKNIEGEKNEEDNS